MTAIRDKVFPFAFKPKKTSNIQPSRNRTKSGEQSTIVKGSWRNLIKCYEMATPEQIIEGESFYEDARDYSKEIGILAGYKYTHAVSIGAGIISVLSPRIDWDRNKEIAKQFILTGETKYQTHTNQTKAHDILSGKDPMDVMGRESHKTKSFYQAILNPNGNNEVWNLQGYGRKKTNLAVIDRHAGGAYAGKPLQEYQRAQLSHWRVNKRISTAYFRGAKYTNRPVNIFQSIIWNVFRDNHKYMKPYPIRRKPTKHT